MLEKILVCLDGSKPAERILPYVTKETSSLNSKIILLSVIDPPDSLVSLNIPGSPSVPMSTQRSVQRNNKEYKEATKVNLNNDKKAM